MRGSPPITDTSATPDTAPGSSVGSTQEQREPRSQVAAPLHAPDIELIGEFKGSGFKDPLFLVRRPDGQVVQLPQLLYRLLEAADGRRSIEQVAKAAGDSCSVELAPEDAAMLVEKKLYPLGLIAGPDGKAPPLQKPDPFLALRAKFKVLPNGSVRAIGTIFRPFFYWPVMMAALGGLAVLDVWLFTQHGIAQSVRQTMMSPEFVLVGLGMIVLSAALHECGHASACLKAGATPGAMGAGLYIVWPVFYTDVTDSYRLGRGGRLLTDLGGVYFNVLFALGLAGLYFLTGWEVLLLIVVLQHLEILHQFLPFVRLDGYYIVSDLTGVPDLFARIRPIIRSLIPRRARDPKVKELKVWARTVVTLWVLIIVPVLLYVFSMMVIHMPRVLATGWDALNTQWDTVSAALDRGNVVSGAAGTATMLALALPLIAMPYTVVMVVRRFSTAAWRKTEGKPAMRTAVAVAIAGVLGFAAFVLWPDGDYRPIGPNERGTIQESVASLSRIQTGTPGLVPAEEVTTPGISPSPVSSVAADPTPSSTPSSQADATTEPSTEPSPSPTTSSTTSPTPTPTPT
jgi:putative peptide zinc metalloprotease protein